VHAPSAVHAGVSFAVARGVARGVARAWTPKTSRAADGRCRRCRVECARHRGRRFKKPLASEKSIVAIASIVDGFFMENG
jgi:hypothetical protein